MRNKPKLIKFRNQDQLKDISYKFIGFTADQNNKKQHKEHNQKEKRSKTQNIIIEESKQGNNAKNDGIQKEQKPDNKKQNQPQNINFEQTKQFQHISSHKKFQDDFSLSQNEDFLQNSYKKKVQNIKLAFPRKYKPADTLERFRVDLLKSLNINKSQVSVQQIFSLQLTKQILGVISPQRRKVLIRQLGQSDLQMQDQYCAGFLQDRPEKTQKAEGNKIKLQLKGERNEIQLKLKRAVELGDPFYSGELLYPRKINQLPRGFERHQSQYLTNMDVFQGVNGCIQQNQLFVDLNSSDQQNEYCLQQQRGFQPAYNNYQDRNSYNKRAVNFPFVAGQNNFYQANASQQEEGNMFYHDLPSRPGTQQNQLGNQYNQRGNYQMEIGKNNHLNNAPINSYQAIRFQMQTNLKKDNQFQYNPNAFYYHGSDHQEQSKDFADELYHKNIGPYRQIQKKVYIPSITKFTKRN